ncbi:DUF2520 domain-containing protein [Marinilabiliaceae bacterium ANBcel2]|nr:DUF2520 domain-containing protein [Marinilabiliaceae bacterium ANBcel2]
MKTITVIGSGNVATHISVALKVSGYTIKEVYSRSMLNASQLADKVDAVALDNISSINKECDLYIISVADNSIEGVVENMPHVKGVVAHTAGSVDVSVLKRFESYGVFYPFQTFTKDKALNFKEIPILVEANNLESQSFLMDIAKTISGRVEKADGKKRALLHVSAVFACNFVNHLYTHAHNLLELGNLDFSLLQPLIEETTQKALSMDPHKAQTGPAVRNDKKVMDKHLSMLDKEGYSYKLYELLSESIVKYHLK